MKLRVVCIFLSSTFASARKQTSSLRAGIEIECEQKIREASGKIREGLSKLETAEDQTTTGTTKWSRESVASDVLDEARRNSSFVYYATASCFIDAPTKRMGQQGTKLFFIRARYVCCSSGCHVVVCHVFHRSPQGRCLASVYFSFVPRRWASMLCAFVHAFFLVWDAISCPILFLFCDVSLWREIKGCILWLSFILELYSVHKVNVVICICISHSFSCNGAGSSSYEEFKRFSN